jgi:hypothetical protein
MRYSMETVRRIYDDEEGVYLQVGSCQDGNPGVVALCTSDTKSAEWYGRFYLGINPEQARLLAVAILARADEAEKELGK